MAARLKRKLYARGGSFETTIPMQMLFDCDLSKKHDVVFEYDPSLKRWLVSFAQHKDKKER